MLTCLSFTTIAKNKILLIGDSLSAGYGLDQEQAWVHLLQNKYDTKNQDVIIVNTAISGQTTDNALLKIDTWLKAHQPSHVLIELGGNDGIRGFPVKLLQKHLTELVTKSQEQGAKVALMKIQIPPNLGARYTSMFTESYNKVAQATGAYLMPYFMLEIAVDPDLILDDNLHPNATAQPIIKDFMYLEINKWLQSIKSQDD
jgi:acyl-CoA thioesterase-1